MNNFNLNLFKYFYYVVYYGGFTNASKNLNLAQSSLSYSIKQLELQLNKQLIIRDNKKFELTEEGNNLYENLKAAFGILNNNLEKFNTYDVSELNIGIRHYLSDFIFKEALNEFINIYPNIHINIHLYSKLDLKKFEEDFDIIIDYEDYTSLILSSNKIKLCSLDNIFIAGKELYNNYENINSIKELANSKLISMCPNKKNGKFQKFCFENNMLFENIISVNDSVLSKKLVKDNIGLSLVNAEYFKEELVSGEVKEIKIQEKLFKDDVYIVYKNNKNINNINIFINLLKKQYEEGK